MVGAMPIYGNVAEGLSVKPITLLQPMKWLTVDGSISFRRVGCEFSNVKQRSVP
jgi:hypothetical protein